MFAYLLFPPVLPGGVVVGLVPVGAVGEGEVVAEVPLVRFPNCHECQLGAQYP